MIQTISPNDDLVLDVVLTDKSGNVIDESLIANLQFVVYTEGTSELQRVYLSKTRYNDGELLINSSELSTLSSGQLYLTTAIALLNSQYNDGSFDYIKTSALPYYLKNSAMSVSDDEAILQWKINVTKSLQNIDSTLRDISVRLHNVEAATGDSSALVDMINTALEGYATIEYVDEQDSSIVNSIPEAVDLTPYATSEEVTEAIRAIPEPDLSPYATTEDVSTALAGKADTSDIPDLEPYALKSAIPSLDGYATDASVAEAIAAIPTVDLTPYATTDDVSTALADKADKSELFSGSYNDLTNKPTIPTATSFKPFNENWDIYNTVEAFGSDVVADSNAVVGMCYLGALECSDLPEDLGIGDAVVEVKGEGNNNKVIHIEITSTEIYPYKWEGDYWQGSFSGWRTYLMNSDLRGYATTSDVSTAIGNIDLSPYATTADVSTALATKANTEDVPDITGLATETYVTQQIGNIDLTPYATTADVSTALAGKADTADIPSLEGYATDASVAEAINAIDFTPYATTADVSTALSTKANTSDLDNYVTDTSLGNILEDYATDASVAATYTTLTQLENVEYSVAVAVNQVVERVENIETTLLDEEDGSEDSSTGDSSTGGETSSRLTFSASPYTITDQETIEYINYGEYLLGNAQFDGENVWWTDCQLDSTKGISVEYDDNGTYVTDSNCSASLSTVSTGPDSPMMYKCAVTGCSAGRSYKVTIPFIYNDWQTNENFYNDYVMLFTTPSAS